MVDSQASRARPDSERDHVRAAALAALALALALGAWGFTVDDALITCRYAHNLARGHGYVLNPGGPASDGVTPLGFAYLLAPFAADSPRAALTFAKLFGVVAHALGVYSVALATIRNGTGVARFAGLAAWQLALPASAWAASGLETPVAAGLIATGASLRLLGRRDLIALTLLGLAAGLRPELLPMAAVLALPRAAHSPPAPFGMAAFGRLALVALPFASAALIRAVVFGQPAPLAVLAKRPDLALGAEYAIAAALLTGVVGLAAPRAFLGASRFGRWLVVAVVAHLGAITFAGGDWMPLARLMVPALPVVALAVAELSRPAKPRWVAVRLCLALAGELFVLVKVGPQALAVMPARDRVIDELRPWLSGRRTVAALDLGVVGAAAPDATLVDLAGVTDPEIARLPGPHHQKRIPDGLLASRGVDTLVFLLADGHEPATPWQATVFSRGVERYVALEPGLAERFEVAFVTPGKLRYVVLVERRDTPHAPVAVPPVPD